MNYDDFSNIVIFFVFGLFFYNFFDKKFFFGLYSQKINAGWEMGNI